jgi:hypothetical protein
VKPGNPVRCRQKGKRSNPRRRSPCAVKAARTVTTGGMGRHSSAVRPVPTHSRVDYGFFPLFLIPFTCVIGRGGASKTRRLILLISVDWVPPDWRPSGAGLDLGARVWFSLFTPPRVTPNRGCASADERSHLRENTCRACNGLSLSSQRDLPGDGPHEGDQFPSHGHHHLIGVFAAGA